MNHRWSSLDIIDFPNSPNKRANLLPINLVSSSSPTIHLESVKYIRMKPFQIKVSTTSC